MKQEEDEKTISLFDAAELEGPSLEELAAKARLAIRQVFEEGRPAVIGYSSGKDSTVVANLVLMEAKQCVAQGLNVFVVVTTSDTLIENPEISEHVRQEHKKMREFAKENGIRLQTMIVEPSILLSWQGKILSGRGLPSWPGGSTDCSQDLKVSVQRTARRKLFKAMKKKGMLEPVTLLGLRFDESERRAMRMKLRGDRADIPRKNKDGELVLSPIAFWTDLDVWEYIGNVTSGLWPGFSDMKEVTRIYADAGGTSCAVVSDSIFEGGSKRKKGGCGARFGCSLCQATVDVSLTNMVEYDPRYAYAKPLVKLNTLIRNTRYDWSKRHWIGRTIKAGFVAIEPDTYHPDFLRTLRRCMLQMDYDERQRAMSAGERPKFQLLPLEMMIAIDALQNLNGVSRPFEAWADLRAIESGVRYDVPEVEPVPPQEMPETKFLYVGNDWDAEFGRPVQGLRSAYVEALTEDSGCGYDLRELRDGHTVWDIETGKGFDVDSESASLVEDFEKSELLKKHDAWTHNPGGICAGYYWYVQYGVLLLDHSQIAFHDMVARRTKWKDLHGLTTDYSIEEVYGRAVRFADLPDDARKAWASKATDTGSQTDFLSVLDETVREIDSLVA